MYSFDGVEKDLQKKTYAREEVARQVAGITPELGVQLRVLSAQYTDASSKYKMEKDEEKSLALMQTLIELGDKTEKLQEKMLWHTNFDVSMKVMDVLLVGGNSGLNKDNFCGDDAEQVWKDFFTQTSRIKLTQSPSK